MSCETTSDGDSIILSLTANSLEISVGQAVHLKEGAELKVSDIQFIHQLE